MFNRLYKLLGHPGGGNDLDEGVSADGDVRLDAIVLEASLPEPITLPVAVHHRRFHRGDECSSAYGPTFTHDPAKCGVNALLLARLAVLG